MIVIACVRRLSLIGALWLAAPGQSVADPLFATPEEPPLPVRLEFAVQQLLDVPEGEVTEFEGQVILEGGERFEAKISPRGKSRREYCSFPPLWLDLPRKSLDGTVLENQNKLKLVTHCSPRLSSRGYLAAEFLAYRILNLLTEASFRVRAMPVTYVDTDSGEEEQYPAFVIEHKKRLAKRLGAEVMDVERVELAQLDPQATSIVAVFQYLVSNYDFSLVAGPEGDACCHNAVPFLLGQQVVGVPYDFDITGLVNPPYAGAPSPRVKSVTQRVYRGYCQHNDALPAAAAEVAGRKAEIDELVSTLNDVPGLQRDRVEKYLRRFYKVVESPAQVQSKMVKRCR